MGARIELLLMGLDFLETEAESLKDIIRLLSLAEMAFKPSSEALSEKAQYLCEIIAKEIKLACLMYFPVEYGHDAMLSDSLRTA